ncbi:CRISPR-associated helicase/endonuclease Cas3 [Actinokineospora iranica]|uniref:CRISPR-associated helicase, Cas3 family n=1 Tax=Actinokineospora iranica TaxID=1271860 RepID=A0A1G6NAS5_9PSEU|nr:CRISPR-associated helicase/endonuclease Cas3 [Actinokineospora iranica]SDC64386.1 CRISPR-associated helicase, Cas3 family [Actinokineospora iranica]
MLNRNTWLSAWAKSDRDEHNAVVAWLPLHQHLDDTAAVAGRLVDDWLSPQVIARIARDLPDGSAGVRKLACWLAGVHDVGKASPAFAVQVPKLFDHMGEHGLVASPRVADSPDRRRAKHALVGHCVVQDWLVEEMGFAKRHGARQLGAIVGSHHGVPPEQTEPSWLRGHPDLVGTGTWAEVRAHLLERATIGIGGRETLAAYRDVVLGKPAQVLLTAIVIVADWIASNTGLFPLRPIATLAEPPPPPDVDETAERLRQAWKQLDFPPRWAAQPLGEDLDQVFRHRFRKPTGTVRPVQVAAVDMARAQTRPGLIIIEAPMGSGKTEAALMAAERLAHASGADGCFLALPTRATSDAMFSRVHDWLEVLPGRADDRPVSVNLAHGKAHLNDQYAGLVRKSRFARIGDDDLGALIAHQWLSGSKKSGLASFVVGTIDQALFSALKSRHVMLRHLGLAGKVVIIDEVHAYDVYMSQYLHRTLHWLGAYGVPVVLLSATLPNRRRAELVHAYDSGSGALSAQTSEDLGYPVVVGSGGVEPQVLDLPPPGTEVTIDHLSDDLDTLVAYLREHLADGGCAVIVRNTVSRAQETADRLTQEFGEEDVTINHSRFLACDRARLDRELIGKFGPPTADTSRPTRHIVVASQVVEQSLDVDFDLMVTDLAPADLVLQRLGRLHRHERTRPASVRLPRCALVGVADWTAAPVTAVRGSRAVYGEHTLLRSAALLAARARIRLPHDIAPLVEAAYGEAPLGPDTWQPAMAAAARAAAATSRKRTENARNFLLGKATGAGNLIGWLSAGVGDVDDGPKGLAQVRDGGESLEVLVVQRDQDGGLLTPDWIESGGEQIPLDQPVPHKQACVIAACALRLPPALCHAGVIDQVIAELEREQITSFAQTHLLKGQLVLVLDLERTTVLHGFHLTYDIRRGLLHDRV